jgi:hypothetical protein
LSAVEVSAPAKPSWTAPVSHTAAAALMPHSSRRLGTTADIENQTARASTSDDGNGTALKPGTHPGAGWGWAPGRV